MFCQLFTCLNTAIIAMSAGDAACS